MRVIQIPSGTKGFDCNTPLSYTAARKFVNEGYRFCLRYVPRLKSKSYDLTDDEAKNILGAGLAIMTVQHVEAGEWMPDHQKAVNYGKTAVAYTQASHIALGTCVWLDLESVSKQASKDVIVDYCNTWWSIVAEAGFTPGIYLGWQNGLTGAEAYYRLKFEHYWAAYNLNKDQHPIVRDVQMKQQTEETLGGITFDPDVVYMDQKGMLPLAMTPDEWDV